MFEVLLGVEAELQTLGEAELQVLVLLLFLHFVWCAVELQGFATCVDNNNHPSSHASNVRFSSSCPYNVLNS